MAIRNSPARRVPGNPLAGVLQQTARKARSTSRKASTPGPEGPQGPPGVGVTGPVAVLTCTLRTDATGVATRAYGQDVPDAVVAVTPVGALQVVVTATDVGLTSATFLARGMDGRPVPDQTLHIVVFGRPLPEPDPEQPAVD